MSKTVPIDDDNFEQLVIKAEKPVLVDFWATWCKPCTMVAPIIDELAEEYGEKISFGKVDVDQNPKAASKYGIMSIPTLLIFKNGEPISHMVGIRPKDEIKRNLDASLE